MPVAIIHIVQGRDPARKRAMIEKVSHALAETLDAPLQTIRVLVREVAPEDWGVGGVTKAELDRK